MDKKLTEEESRKPLYNSGNNIALYTNPNEKSDRTLAAIGELLSALAVSKGKTDVEAGRYSQLMIENKPQDANNYLLEVLRKRDLL